MVEHCTIVCHLPSNWPRSGFLMLHHVRWSLGTYEVLEGGSGVRWILSAYGGTIEILKLLEEQEVP